MLRFDSFSKLLSSGMRLGFATGPPALVTAPRPHIPGTRRAGGRAGGRLLVPECHGVARRNTRAARVCLCIQLRQGVLKPPCV